MFLCSKKIDLMPFFFFSLCAAGEGGYGAGDATVREGQGTERGAARSSDTDLPGTSCMFVHFTLLVLVTLRYSCNWPTEGSTLLFQGSL